MFDLDNNLGVQSYCFRGFKSVPALIEQVKAIGLTRCELCGVHVDFDDDKSFAGIMGQFRDAGVAISSIGVQKFSGEPHEEKWFDFAKAAGATMINATYDLAQIPGVFDVVAKWAEKYGLFIGIHNHGGYDWLGNGMMLQHLTKNFPERVGLCLDTAWCLQAGEDPLTWAEKMNAKLFGVHIKDFVFDRAGKWSDVIVGTGNLRLREFLAIARAAPRMAAMTLEYEGDVDNPGPALRECVAAVRTAL